MSEEHDGSIGSGGGLYNTVFGTKSEAGILLTLLNRISPFDPGRFRDGRVEREGDWLAIRIHTRNGGGNREGQAEPIASMRAHPWYDRDADASFDVTYADFWFRPPLDLLTDAPTVERFLRKAAMDPVDVGAKWRAAIDAMGRRSR